MIPRTLRLITLTYPKEQTSASGLGAPFEVPAWGLLSVTLEMPAAQISVVQADKAGHEPNSYSKVIVISTLSCSCSCCTFTFRSLSCSLFFLL